MSTISILYILTIISALTGFWITLRIHREKLSKKPMFCPLNGNCEIVVNSEFSTFFGISLELYGAAYYAFIALSYIALFAFLPQQLPDLFNFFLVGFSIVGFLFSLYLTFIQAFYIKSWCTWCLFSAGISTLIFVFTTIGLVVTNFSLIPILTLLATPILVMHFIGFIFGVGGATVTDIIFLKFLRDFKISDTEKSVLKILSQVIWLGLLAIVISGIGLYLPNAEILNESPKFIMKMIAVLAVIINGLVLTLVIEPKLLKTACSDCVHVLKINKLRKLCFVLGSISFVSWYSALLLGIIKNIPLTLDELLTIYLLVILFAILSSQVLENLIVKNVNSSTKV